jgi:hypothetical protein
MTKENVRVEDYEDKKTTAGKRYTRFKTTAGYMSCFNEQAAKDLKEYEGKLASVEIKEVGKYKNIDKVYGDAEPTTDEEQVEIQSFKDDRTEQVDRAKALEIAKGDPNLAEAYYTYIRKGN